MSSSEHETGKLNTPPGETPDRGCPGTEDDKGPTLSDALRRVAARSDTSTGLLFTPQKGDLGDRFGNGRPTLRGGVAPNSRPACKPVRCLFRAPARSHPTNPGYFHTSSVVLPTVHTSYFHTECGAARCNREGRPSIYDWQRPTGFTYANVLGAGQPLACTSTRSPLAPRAAAPPPLSMKIE